MQILHLSAIWRLCGLSGSTLFARKVTTLSRRRTLCVLGRWWCLWARRWWPWWWCWCGCGDYYQVKGGGRQWWQEAKQGNCCKSQRLSCFEASTNVGTYCIVDCFAEWVDVVLEQRLSPQVGWRQLCLGIMIGPLGYNTFPMSYYDEEMEKDFSIYSIMIKNLVIAVLSVLFWLSSSP